MCKRVFLLVVAVLVSASSPALSIPAVSKVSEYDRDEGIQGEGERKQKLRGNDDAIDSSEDERARLPISMRESSKQLQKAGAAQLRDAHVINDAVANYYGYKIKIKSIEVSLKELHKRLGTSKIDDNKFLLMAVGDAYIESLPHLDRSYVVPHGHRVFRQEMYRTLFQTWITLLRRSGYQPNRVFEKMRVLRNGNMHHTMDLEDYAYMAMGSEFLSRTSNGPHDVPILPSLESISKEHGVDLSKLKQWIEKLETDPTYNDKSDEELLQLATRRTMGEDLTLG